MSTRQYVKGDWAESFMSNGLEFESEGITLD